MSTPVLVKYNKLNSSASDGFGTMSFYLGNKYENEAQPDDSNAYLYTFEPKKYAVITYGGFSNESDQEENLRTLESYWRKLILNMLWIIILCWI